MLQSYKSCYEILSAKDLAYLLCLLETILTYVIT